MTTTPEQILHLWDTEPCDPTIWPHEVVRVLRQAIGERNQALARVAELEDQNICLRLDATSGGGRPSTARKVHEALIQRAEKAETERDAIRAKIPELEAELVRFLTWAGSIKE